MMCVTGTEGARDSTGHGRGNQVNGAVQYCEKWQINSAFPLLGY